MVFSLGNTDFCMLVVSEFNAADWHSPWLECRISLGGYNIRKNWLPNIDVQYRSWVISILVALLLITAFSVPMTFVINLLVFGKPVEMDTIYAILQSYLSQIIEFWGAFLGLRAALAFAVITLFFIIISYLFRSAHNHKFKTFVITSLLIVISSIQCQ